MTPYEMHQMMVVTLAKKLAGDYACEHKMIETHSAWVILVGDFAFKIKKPVNFGFLDFSTKEKRRRFCELEVGLNSRFSQQIYLGVEKIVGTFLHPRFAVENDRSHILDYAVKMLRFPEGALLSDLLAENRVEVLHIEALAHSLAHFHTLADEVPEDFKCGCAEHVNQWMMDNFKEMMPLLSFEERDEVSVIEQYVSRLCLQLSTTFEKRKQNGFIRDCHGDLHLNNVVVLNNRPVFFDCIEFNDELRWIDTFSELAFLVMDLIYQDRSALASLLLNVYLQQTGDYDGLKVLPFYLIYRALVRAKVALIRRAQTEEAGDSFYQESGVFEKHLTLAQRFIDSTNSIIFITYGLSGSGKSTVAKRLANEFNAIHIRSDIERKRLANKKSLDKTGMGLNEGIYSGAASAEVYERLRRLSRIIIESGFSVVVDAAFLKRDERQKVNLLAKELNVQCLILHCRAEVDELEKRIGARLAEGEDPSEATVEVLRHQIDNLDKLCAHERTSAITINTQNEDYLKKMIQQIQQAIR